MHPADGSEQGVSPPVVTEYGLFGKRDVCLYLMYFT